MLDKKWHLFTIGGHPVYMTPSFLIIMALFTLGGARTSADLLGALLWAPVLFFGILWHELGHATASRLFGYGPSTILFWGLGGLAINGYAGHRDPKRSMLVSLAGPFASLLLAIASAGALFAYTGSLAASDLLAEFLRLSFVANLFWAVFNMLPIYPMDGGQSVLYGATAITKDARKSAKLTGGLSIAIIIATLVAFKAMNFSVGIFELLLGGYFGYLSWNLIQSGRAERWGV